MGEKQTEKYIGKKTNRESIESFIRDKNGKKERERDEERENVCVRIRVNVRSSKVLQESRLLLTDAKKSYFLFPFPFASGSLTSRA